MTVVTPPLFTCLFRGKTTPDEAKHGWVPREGNVRG